MPWSNQSGGPWGPKNSGKPQGPWGGGPQGGPPDLEDMLRRGQDKLRGMMPGGGGAVGGKGIVLIALGAFALWLASGFYTVRPDEVGINLIFGRYVGKTSEGLRYNLPYPIGNVIKPRVTTVNTIEVGLRSIEREQRVNQRNVLEESLMLTGDENIVDIDFSVQWQIDPAKAQNYVFNLQNPDGTIKAVAESVMREVIGGRNIQNILTTDRGAIEAKVKAQMQDVLDAYGAGVEIRLVQLQKVDPPQQVIDAFRDVQAAKQDQDRARNEAETYASQKVPQARGRAISIVQAAEAYKQQVTNEAKGEAARFTSVYEQYKNAPSITRERIYLETMERVLGRTNKIILDQKGQQGVVPYLPLSEMGKTSGSTSSNGAAQ